MKKGKMISLMGLEKKKALEFIVQLYHKFHQKGLKLGYVEMAGQGESNSINMNEIIFQNNDVESVVAKTIDQDSSEVMLEKVENIYKLSFDYIFIDFPVNAQSDAAKLFFSKADLSLVFFSLTEVEHLKNLRYFQSLRDGDFYLRNAIAVPIVNIDNPITWFAYHNKIKEGEYGGYYKSYFLFEDWDFSIFFWQYSNLDKQYSDKLDYLVNENKLNKFINKLINFSLDEEGRIKIAS